MMIRCWLARIFSVEYREALDLAATATRKRDELHRRMCDALVLVAEIRAERDELRRRVVDLEHQLRLPPHQRVDGQWVPRGQVVRMAWLEERVQFLGHELSRMRGGR